MSEATLSGWEWLVDVTNHVGAAIIILAVLGVSVFSGWKLPSPWWGVLIGVTFGVLLFAEGAYRVARDHGYSDKHETRTHKDFVLEDLSERLRDGHLLDARLRNTSRRDDEWGDLIHQIDVWTFDLQLFLYNSATEFVSDFDGDWAPDPLRSRYQISEDFRARLRELSKVVQSMRSV